MGKQKERIKEITSNKKEKKELKVITSGDKRSGDKKSGDKKRKEIR